MGTMCCLAEISNLRSSVDRNCCISGLSLVKACDTNLPPLALIRVYLDMLNLCSKCKLFVAFDQLFTVSAGGTGGWKMVGLVEV